MRRGRGHASRRSDLHRCRFTGGVARLALGVVDVSDPALPIVLGRLAPDQTGPEYPSAVAVVGRFALLLEEERLHVVDIGDPTAPQHFF